MNISVKISGLRELIGRFNQAPKIIDEEIQTALKYSLSLIERNVKLRTPVDTGRLRASIGKESTEGWKWVRQTIASIGTRVKYAFWVEVRPARHVVGEVGYFSKGVAASISGINNFFAKAMQKVASRITK